MITHPSPAYLKRVAANILPISRNQQNVVEALKEWEYRGDKSDVEDAVETCQLCDHYPIRYQFEIVNRFTKSLLNIGSECITRFDVAVIDEEGIQQRGAVAAKIVAKERRELEEESRRRTVRRALVQLAKMDQSIDAKKLESIADAADNRGLSPRQASLIVWRLGVNGIELPRSYLKVMLKKAAEQNALLVMDDFRLRQLWPCLTVTQQQWYREKKPIFDEKQTKRAANQASLGLPWRKK